MTIEEIIEMPTVINNTHESIYRSWHILELVTLMLKRGDSNETILEVIIYIQSQSNRD